MITETKETQGRYLDMIEDNQLTGFKTYRHSENPDEKVFHDAFIEEWVCTGRVEQICRPTDERSRPDKSFNEDETRTCISLIQWLGSPAGQSFLRDCGFVKQINS